MGYIVRTFKFEEAQVKSVDYPYEEVEGTFVSVIFLKRHHNLGSPGCDPPHTEYLHVRELQEATVFETVAEAEEARHRDTTGWTKYHASSYLPPIKKLLIENGLWGQVIEVENVIKMKG